MIFFPGCKINIGLNVINKRPDGYHNLESIFFPLHLTDVLEIIQSDHFSIETTGLPIDGDHSFAQTSANGRRLGRRIG
jgi:4-diphosphocytidyl-2-C-methyl-D-erythritol kinase